MVVTKDASTVMLRHVDAVNIYRSSGVRGGRLISAVCSSPVYVLLTTRPWRQKNHAHPNLYQSTRNNIPDDLNLRLLKIRFSIGENGTGRKIQIFSNTYAAIHF